MPVESTATLLISPVGYTNIIFNSIWDMQITPWGKLFKTYLSIALRGLESLIFHSIPLQYIVALLGAHQERY